jgi:ribosome-binding factor A
MRGYRRADRVAEAIREEVATFLRNEAGDRLTGFVTVTGVDVTRDLRHATVFVSVMGDDAEQRATLTSLDALAAPVRGHLARALRLRVAPEVRFKRDESIARAARIEALLQQVRPADEPDGDAPGTTEGAAGDEGGGDAPAGR